MVKRLGSRVVYPVGATREHKEYLLTMARREVGENLYSQIVSSPSPVVAEIKESNIDYPMVSFPNDPLYYPGPDGWGVDIEVNLRQVNQMDVTQYFTNGISSYNVKKLSWWDKVKKLVGTWRNRK